ncbi:MAG: SDR family oxidoreductase [Candidatus Omnitrophota bacterium]|nr:MAG: SDR family oxidoreductase [Candidatus Omnitrophota bacterium]
MGNKGSKGTVLITGATGDIGRAIATRFAGGGWNIICHYFSSKERAVALKSIIEKYKVNCALFRANLLSERQLSVFISRLKKINIDSLINNAGTCVGHKHFDRLTVRDITSTFMVNTFAPTLLAAAVFKRMKARRFGRVVNISSIAAKYGSSSHSIHYGTSKLALEGLTKTLAREGAKHNVLVNTIRPGVINTKFHKKFPKDMKKRVKLIPLRKIGTPADIADMAYCLGSEKNNFITNEIITISGGE